jgi:hypothetical protein
VLKLDVRGDSLLNGLHFDRTGGSEFDPYRFTDEALDFRHRIGIVEHRLGCLGRTLGLGV